VRRYVSYETEEGQRAALNALTVGTFQAHFDRANSLPVANRFRGQNVLRVEESTEPSAIRWADLGITTTRKYLQRAVSYTLTGGVIVGAAYAVYAVNLRSKIWAALLISVFNTLIPITCYILNSIESHASDGNRQMSLYLKIAVARWTNTAVIIFIVTPFTESLSSDLLFQVYTVLLADMISYPLFRLLDPVGNLKRFFVAPLCGRANQAEMNGWMSGTEWSLAERYTDVTKTMFLAFWYAAVFPLSYAFCFVATLLNYSVDKICLLRFWARHPRTGLQVARKVRSTPTHNPNREAKASKAKASGRCPSAAEAGFARGLPGGDPPKTPFGRRVGYGRLQRAASLGGSRRGTPRTPPAAGEVALVPARLGRAARTQQRH
jgi:hypothetical protein